MVRAEAEILQQLLAAAPQAAMAADIMDCLPLHYAAVGAREAIVRALLATAAQAAMAAAGNGLLRRHGASSEAAAHLLLAAAPAAAMVRDVGGRLPSVCPAVSSSRTDVWKRPMRCFQPLRPMQRWLPSWLPER